MQEQLLDGRYRLLRPLGTGGMATVYLADDLRLGRRVAVKILHPQFEADPNFVARFTQEARVAAGLAHPNIVQVYDVGNDGDRHYIVMEYVEGQTLKDVVAQQGPMAVPRALTIIGGVLAAVAFAHANNLIHRDIKSQNILLTPTGDVKVADFGIARELSGAAAPTLTATGMVIGTVQYFSPEQAQGRPATARSDVYAVGIVLFEMLTARLPFEGDNPFAVAMQQINQAPPLPTRLNAAIPRPAEAIVLKALAKNPDERYPSAESMKAAVDGIRTGASAPTRITPRSIPVAGEEPRAPAPTRTTRPVTRPATQVNVRQQPVPVRKSNRNTWLVLAAFIAILAALLGVYAAQHGLPILTGAPTATPTPSNTPVPTVTNTPRPTPTHRIVVVPPTRTPVPTSTATPAPSPTPTDTHTPVPTPSPLPSDTATPVAIPTQTQTPAAGPPVVTITPATAKAGDTVTVSGSGWPSDSTVTLSADFGNGMQTLDRVTAADGTFSDAISLPNDTTPAVYQITATDDQGHSASGNLTVNG